MRSRTAAVAVALSAAVIVAGCDGTSSGGTASGGTPGTSSAGTSASPGTSAGGPFTLPANACDLTSAAAVEKVAGRTSVKLTHAGVAPTGSTSKALTCAFTDGLVPVGLLTVDEHPLPAGHTAAQELGDSVTGSVYRSSSTKDISGLGDAARYGRTSAIAGLAYATVWTVVVRGGQVGDLTLTIASHDADASQPALVDLTRTVLGQLTG